MKFKFSIVFALTIWTIFVSAAHAKEAPDAILMSVATQEIKNAWLELDQVKPDKKAIRAKEKLRNALVAIYSAQGKELKALTLKTASQADISGSIKAQAKHQVKDFPYPASSYFLWAQKASDDSFTFWTRNPCRAYFYEINVDSPDYVECKKFLAHLVQDNEWHQVPSEFPSAELLKEKYLK